MYSFPNQNIITIHKTAYKRDFLQIGIDEWQAACKVLTPSAFKIYLYLASNADKFSFALSKQDIQNNLGISFSRFYEAIKLLRQLHYICIEGSNHFHFFLAPNPDFEKEHGIQDWESKNTVSNLKKTDPISRPINPYSENFVLKETIEIDNINETNNRNRINTGCCSSVKTAFDYELAKELGF